jgi:hydroxymethylpyrimidine pyrophosphatase-like HAD family hydrolase
MRYHALACDYDGTIAHHGIVDQATIETLQRLRGTGRKLLLVTGRELDDLLRVFPHIDLFERVVAENGALLYCPATREEKVLAEPPPQQLVTALKERGVAPLGVGRVIVATWEPHQGTVLEVIRQLGLELQVIFNKGAVMVLPSGVNKATGLRAALTELGVSVHNTVGVGDAENDHAFLTACECAVAVANALPKVKERADLVLNGDHGAGVRELVERLMASDISEAEPRLARHHLLLGTTPQGEPVTLSPFNRVVLITGMSGGGKSTAATGFLERLAEREYQFCILDPEGDYESFEGATTVGDAQHAPSATQVMELLAKPQQNVSVNMLGVELAERPAFFQTLLSRIQELRVQTGRPHWLVVDEAHHLFPSSSDPNLVVRPPEQAMLLITVHPDSVSRTLLSAVDTVVSIGEAPEKTLQSLALALEETPPEIPPVKLDPGEALLWVRFSGTAPSMIRTIPPSADRRRHRRKYAEGELGEDRSFYFRGREGKLNLRAQNLTTFLQLAKGVDEDTWQYHLQNGDYSHWFRSAIKDQDLAEETAFVEQRSDLSPQETLAAIESALKRRYTAPA